MPIQLDASDRLLASVDRALKTLSGVAQAGRPRPQPRSEPGALTPDERRLSGALMRVNHVGEICAQALYEAQSLGTRTPAMREQFAQAAREETDHLAWTRERLRELDARPSLLNPLWYAGSFGIGWLAAKTGDAASLGFLVETERQVEQHLASHLERLPPADTASRAIVAQMKDDEARHAGAATAAGARNLPAPARWLMRIASGAMTRTAHYL